MRPTADETETANEILRAAGVGNGHGSLLSTGCRYQAVLRDGVVCRRYNTMSVPPDISEGVKEELVRAFTRAGGTVRRIPEKEGPGVPELPKILQRNAFFMYTYVNEADIAEIPHFEFAVPEDIWDAAIRTARDNRAR